MNKPFFSCQSGSLIRRSPGIIPKRVEQTLFPPQTVRMPRINMDHKLVGFCDYGNTYCSLCHSPLLGGTLMVSNFLLFLNLTFFVPLSLAFSATEDIYTYTNA